MRTLFAFLVSAFGLYAAAPVISSVTAVPNSPTTIKVTWTTNIAADSCVGYSTASGGPYTYPGGSATATLCVQDTSSDTGLTTSHTYILWGLNSSTTYYIVPVSTDGAGNSTTGTQVSAATIAAYTTKALAFSLGGATRYNDGFHGINGVPTSGNYESGDTHAFAWADDGYNYVSVNDTPVGANGGLTTNVGGCTGSGRNLMIYKQTSQSNLFSMANRNTMDDYGTETCNNNAGYSDGDNWKSEGLTSVNGALYYSVYRQHNGTPWNGQTPSIIKSMDHGATWCNTTHASLTGCTTSSATGDAPGPANVMWSNASGMRAPSILPYCQDNHNCANPVDNADVWTYLYSSDQTFANEYLLRVKTALLPRLQTSDYQYYTGGDGNLDSSWSTSYSGAANILPVVTAYTQPVYIPLFKRYMTVGWSGGAKMIEAPHPWGPWTVVSSFDNIRKSLNFPHPVMSTYSEYSNYATVQVAWSGNYLLTTSAQDTTGYNLYFTPLTITAQSSSTAISVANAARQIGIGDGKRDLVRHNLKQFLEFYPESGTTHTDLSGQGNNATDAAIPTYGRGGVTSYNNGGTFYTATNVDMSSWTDFTMFLVNKFYNPSAPPSGQAVWGKFVDGTHNLLITRATSSSSCTTGTATDYFCLELDGVFAGPFKISDGAWQMWIVRRSGGTTTVYDSSTFDQTATSPTPLLTTTSLTGALPVGGPNIPAAWTGYVSAYAVYNTGLTDSELRQNVHALRLRLKQGHGIYVPTPLGSGKVLDEQAPPIAAYSTRQLLSSYSGYAMQVRRDSDNATQNIPFNNSGDIDVSSSGPLRSFCGSASCYVTTWYDQSGGHNDLSQATTTNQFRVVSAGVADTMNGKLTLVATTTTATFDNTGKRFFLYGAEGSCSAVTELDSGTAAYAGICGVIDYPNLPNVSGSAVVSGALLIRDNANSNVRILRNSTGPGSAYTAGTPFSATSVIDGYNYRTIVNGTETKGTTNISSSSPNFFSAISLKVGAGFLGKVSEVTVWDQAIASTTVSALRASHQSYFGTP